MGGSADAMIVTVTEADIVTTAARVAAAVTAAAMTTAIPTRSPSGATTAEKQTGAV